MFYYLPMRNTPSGDRQPLRSFLDDAEAVERAREFVDARNMTDEQRWQATDGLPILLLPNMELKEFAAGFGALPAPESQIVLAVSSCQTALLSIPSRLFRALSATAASCQIHDCIDLNRGRIQQERVASANPDPASQVVLADRCRKFTQSVTGILGKNVFPA